MTEVDKDIYLFLESVTGDIPNDVICSYVIGSKTHKKYVLKNLILCGRLMYNIEVFTLSQVMAHLLLQSRLYQKLH